MRKTGTCVVLLVLCVLCASCATCVSCLNVRAPQKEYESAHASWEAISNLAAGALDKRVFDS